MEQMNSLPFEENSLPPKEKAFPTGKREFVFLLLILLTSWLLCNSVF